MQALKLKIRLELAVLKEDFGIHSMLLKGLIVKYSILLDSSKIRSYQSHVFPHLSRAIRQSLRP